jgi:CRP-like cAMP-binding protein
MDAAGVNPDLFRNIYPLNQLAPRQLEEVAGAAQVADLAEGHELFAPAQKPTHLYYVLDGKVDLLDERGRAFMSAVPHLHMDAMPLPPMLPSPYLGRTAQATRVLRIDRKKLYAVLFRHRPDLALSAELGFAGEDSGAEPSWDESWLRWRGFRRIPRARLDTLIARMQRVRVKAGDILIQQGSAPDWFYVIAQGRCAVTHKQPGATSKMLLEECGSGACLGEDGLITGEPRNATVKMLTDGAVMRLDAETFQSLVKPSLAVAVDAAKARALIERGARWLDVRMPTDPERRKLRDALCVPRPKARLRMFDVDPDQSYVVACGSSRDSAVIAFMLAKFGLDASYLAGGLVSLPAEDFLA